jgi:hypothetical protein
MTPFRTTSFEFIDEPRFDLGTARDGCHVRGRQVASHEAHPRGLFPGVKRDCLPVA